MKNIDLRDPNVDPEKLWDDFCVYFYNQKERPFCQPFKELCVGFTWTWNGLLRDVCHWVGFDPPYLVKDVPDEILLLVGLWVHLGFIWRTPFDIEFRRVNDCVFKKTYSETEKISILTCDNLPLGF